MTSATIRDANRDDVDAILWLCSQHAKFEQVTFSKSGPDALPQSDALAEYLFADSSAVRCLVVEQNGQLVGYTSFVLQESTWRARPYLYMDCLFLIDQVRGEGIGQALMDAVRREATSLNCDRVQWQTPSFNSNAIRFYHRLGATSKDMTRFTWHIDNAAEPALLSQAEPSTALAGIPMSNLYEPRATRLLSVRDCNNWKFKVYQITLPTCRIPSAIVESAMEHIHENADWPDNVAERFGFVVLHTGENLLWLQAKIWVGDILRQFIYCAPLSNPTAFSNSPLPGFSECVWELQVTNHERDAWIRHVMSQAEPKFDAYLQDVLTIE